MRQCLLRLRPGDQIITNADRPNSWMWTRFEILSLPREIYLEPPGILIQVRVLSRGDKTRLPSDGKPEEKFIQFQDYGTGTRRILKRAAK